MGLTMFLTMIRSRTGYAETVAVEVPLRSQEEAERLDRKIEDAKARLGERWLLHQSKVIRRGDLPAAPTPPAFLQTKLL